MKNFLKEIRISKSITQQDLADLVQVSRQSIISIETNRYTPSILLSLKLAKVLGKKVEDIFYLERGD
ncbi:helix-turn-helix transcriptional regulator [Pollutibacter soli]|uniref:helix-turn-helix transcriptional regulator n=1 Tax=Pollutibacter soli TaxID=3034157 RepID=UPI003013B8E1